MKGAIALIVACCMPWTASAQVLRCDIQSKQRCEAASGCSAIGAGLWYVLDLANKTIARCDAKGCDTYAALFSVSGQFLNVALPQNGMMAKLDTATMAFSESATLMQTVLVSFGMCRRT